MNRATFEVGREPARPDPLRQVPVDDETRPDPEMVERIRRALAPFNNAKPRAPSASEAV